MTLNRAEGLNRFLRSKDLLLGVGLVAACLVLAATLTGYLYVPLLSQLPPTALLAVIVFAAASPMLITRWRLAFWTLICWLMVEDLIRKLAGNALGVYVLKDVVYIVLLTGVFLSGEARGAWRAATGRARIALSVLIVWAIVMAVPTFFQKPTLPFIGLRVDFLYVPMVAVAFVYVKTRDDLRRLIFGLAVILAITSALGIIQAIVGPEFLAPGVITPGLDNLETVRGLSEGQRVYRPTGTFVDPGRYASMALVGVAVSLAAFVLTKRAYRVTSAVCVVVCGGGVWVSGGRSPLLIAFSLILIAFLTVRSEAGRRSFIQAGAIASSMLAIVIILMLFLPNLLESRLDWYSRTLDPGSRNNEWASRWNSYTSAISNGLSTGGILGKGTGSESVGKQYLTETGTITMAGQFTVESGYAAVAVEWGAIGLVLWIVWVTGWSARWFWSVRQTRAGPVRTATAVLVGWMFILIVIQFYSGMATFQNYIANFFFWLLSGVVFAAPVASRSQGRPLSVFPQEHVPTEAIRVGG